MIESSQPVTYTMTNKATAARSTAHRRPCGAMFRLVDEPLPPPGRNPEEAFEELLEEGGAENGDILQPTLPPVLRWRCKQATGPPRPCRALIITTHGTRALLPLFLPNLPHPSAGAANYDDQLLLASILIPGASLSGNRACSASHPGNAGCFLYRASLPSEEKEEDAVLVCACNVEAPLESQHAVARILLNCVRPSGQTLIVDLLKDGSASPGDELAPHALHGLLADEDSGGAAPFLVRTLQTTVKAAGTAATAAAVPLGTSPLEEGVPLMGVGAAMLARCEMLRLPATALVLALPQAPATKPAFASAFARQLAAVVLAVRVTAGLDGGEDTAALLLQTAAEQLQREGQGRLAMGSSSSMLYV